MPQFCTSKFYVDKIDTCETSAVNWQSDLQAHHFRQMTKYRKDYDTIVRSYIDTVEVGCPTCTDDQSVSQHFSFTALWDTGSTATLISSAVVQQLNPPLLNRFSMSGGVGSQPLPTLSFVVSIKIGHIVLPCLTVEHIVPQKTGDSDDIRDFVKEKGVDVIIGATVLEQGDFLLTNQDGKTHIRFQKPSSGVISL